MDGLIIMKREESKLKSSLKLSPADIDRIFDKLEKEEREQEKLKRTISILNPRKKIKIRKESNKKIRDEDDWLIRKYLFHGEQEALFELIDCYTPLIKSMVWKPFFGMIRRVRRLYPLQMRINNLRADKLGNHYISSLTHDIIAEALLEFCQLVHLYIKEAGSFSGYVKNFLPLSMELIFRQIIREIDSVYLDGLPEESKELFELQYLSYENPDEEEMLELEKYNFTDRQREIALLLSEGYNDTQTGKIIGISRQAVLKHKGAIRKKMSKFNQNAC